MTAFVEENGTGVTDATSYVTVEYSDSYLGAEWAINAAAKEAALILGSEYVDARWGDRIESFPLLETQGLELPRSRLNDRYGVRQNGVPKDWQRAVCLYAQESVSGTLYPSPPATELKDVKKKKTTVGPISTEVEYRELPEKAVWLRFGLADKLVRQFLVTRSGVMRN